jgi:hypothetical protein
VVAFGAPMMMGLFLFYIGIVALIPFVSGILRFHGSQRIDHGRFDVRLGSIYLDSVSFSDALKFQTVYRPLFLRVGTTALLTVELLFHVRTWPIGGCSVSSGTLFTA